MGLLLLMGDSGTPLLDRYPAAMAYSLRRLRTAYSGSAIRVRRSSDNAEQDIGFSGAGLDTASLLSFCGAGNGFVTTWHDQAASSNAIQTTHGSQPQIVSSGSLITENGKPALKFDGANTLLRPASGKSIASPSSVFIVCESPSVTDDYLFDGFGGTANRLAVFSATANTIYGVLHANNSSSLAVINSSAKAAAGNQTLLSLIKNGASSVLRQNTVQIASGTITTDPWNALTIGARQDGAQPYADRMQELIVFESNQTANLTVIERNINQFYLIY